MGLKPSFRHVLITQITLLSQIDLDGINARYYAVLTIGYGRYKQFDFFLPLWLT